MKVVERDIEYLEVLVLFGGDPRDQFLGGYVLLPCLDHDRRTVRVRGTDVGANMTS